MTMAAFKMFSGDKGNTDVDVQLRLRLLRFSIGTNSIWGLPNWRDFNLMKGFGREVWQSPSCFISLDIPTVTQLEPTLSKTYLYLPSDENDLKSLEDSENGIRQSFESSLGPLSHLPCDENDNHYEDSGNDKRVWHYGNQFVQETGLHKLCHPTIRDGSTWSKFRARGEHGDVFLVLQLRSSDSQRT